MPKQEPSREPFELKEEPIYEGFLSVINESESNPNKVIKQELLIDNSIDNSISYYSNVKEVISKMKNDYGINMPDTDIVIGEKRKGSKRVFIVSDKIIGKNLVETNRLVNSEKERFERFYNNILQAMFDAYKEGKPFYKDVHAGNIMYGYKSKEENTENDFFLTDVGRMSIEEDPKKNFIEIIIEILSTLPEYEQKFGKGAKLKTIRSKFKKIYDYLKSDEINKKVLDSAMETYMGGNNFLEEIEK